MPTHSAPSRPPVTARRSCARSWPTTSQRGCATAPPRSAGRRERRWGGAARAAMEEVVALDGDVGLLAIDAEGNVALPFAADVFHRAVKRAGEPVRAAVSSERMVAVPSPGG